jgi:hypothetical protein
MGADDLIDTVSGTLGLGGAVDSVLILGKEQDTQEGRFLWGRGRDLEEFSVSVKQNDKGRWDVLGQRAEAQPSAERSEIITLLAKTGRPMKITEIALQCRGKYENVKQLLSKLQKEGCVVRISSGLYNA